MNKNRFLSFLIVLIMVFLCIPVGMFAESEDVVLEEVVINGTNEAAEELATDVTEERPAEKLITEETAVEDLAVAETTAEESAEEEPSTAETATEEITAEEPSTAETSTEEITAEEPSVEEPETVETTTEETVAEETVEEKQVDAEPAVEELEAEEFVVEESAAEESVAEELLLEEIPIFEINGDVLIKYNGEDEEVTIPDGIKEIGKKAFASNKSIKKVIFPDSVETINSSAFADCLNLEKVIFTDQSKLKTVGWAAFKNCKQLDISFADGIETVVGNAFEGIVIEEKTDEGEKIEEESTLLDEYNESDEVPSDIISIEAKSDEEMSIEKSYSPVSEPITITTQPQSKEVVEGEYFVASVEAEGSNLTYQWEFKKVGTTEWKVSADAAYKEAELRVKAAAVLDGRQYRCVISDDQGHTVTSNEVTLTIATEPVPDPITITTQPVSSEVAVGEYFIATVVAEGSNLTYQWEFKKVGTTEWKVSADAAYKVAELRVKATAALDGRQYRCVISDDQGHTVISEEVTLTIVSEFTDGTFRYKLTDNGNGIIITGYLLNEAAVVIPTRFNNLPVVEIGEEAFMGNTSLTSITLPNTITVIRARAFKGCTNLSTMNTH